MNRIGNVKLSARDRLEESNISSNLIENVDFINFNPKKKGTVKSGSNAKLVDAENEYFTMMNDIKFTGKETVEEVKKKYEEKIQQWNEDKNETIREYEAYIKSLRAKKDCPNMKDYIHKKKIPCWGCQL
jgi:hypothetical protein